MRGATGGGVPQVAGVPDDCLKMTVPGYSPSDRRGAVSNVEVVDEVDRDGDGYASGFVIEVTMDSRPICFNQPPSRFLKMAASIASIGTGVPWGQALTVLKQSASVELLVPGVFVLGTTDSWPIRAEHSLADSQEWASHPGVFPHMAEEYAAHSFPGRDNETFRYVVGSAAEEHGNDVPGRLTTEASEFTGSDGYGRLDSLTLRSCYQVTLVGEASDLFETFNTQGDCITGDLSAGSWVQRGPAFDAVKDAIRDSNPAPYVHTLTEPIQIETPETDRVETMVVGSNAPDAHVMFNRMEVGRTPWAGEVPVDLGAVGPTEVPITSTHGTTTVTISAADTQEVTVWQDNYTTYRERIASPTNVEATQVKLTDPLTVTSEEPGANVTVDGTLVGQTPWSDRRWIGQEYEVVLNAPGKLPHRFTGVEAGQTIHADLVNTSSVLNTIDSSTLNSALFNGSDGGETTENVTEASTDEDDLILSDSLFSSDAVTDAVADLRSVEVVDSNLTVSPSRTRVDQPVAFDGQPSYSLVGSVATYQWDFGDGSRSGALTSPTRTHAYSQPGTYTVELSVTDTEGNTDTAVRRVTVTDTPPDAHFGTTAASHTTEAPVRFNASASSDLEGAISTYEWAFGDGTTGRGSQVAHRYDSGGTYRVTLTVTDEGGNAANQTRTINVREPNVAPTAQYSHSATANATRLTFDASDAADPDGSISRYLWIFDGANTTTGETVTHSFDSPGAHTVELLVVDDDGASHAVNRTLELSTEASARTPTPARSTTPPAGTDGPVASPPGGGEATTALPDGEPGDAAEAGATTTAASGPGFGALGALLALTLLALAAGRRSRRRG